MVSHAHGVHGVLLHIWGLFVVGLGGHLELLADEDQVAEHRKVFGVKWRHVALSPCGAWCRRVAVEVLT
jgi:hypothetical protein